MKIFAVKQHEVAFDLSSPKEFYNTTISLSPSPCLESSSDANPNPMATKGLREIQQISKNAAENSIKLKFQNVTDRGNNVSPGSSSSNNGSVSRRRITVEGSFLNELSEVYDGSKVAVTIEGLRCPEARIYNNNFRDITLPEFYQGPHFCTLKTKEMEICDGKVVCEDDITLPEVWTRLFATVRTHLPSELGIRRYCIRISISIDTPSQTRNTCATAVVRKMLEESIETDAVLVAACGTEIKCHKSFLSAHSTELANNFQNGFREATTGRVELVDMSKDGIVAFLQYLYYRGTSKPEEDSSIALELLQAAHKYNVKPLEKEMKLILVVKKVDWYDVGVALRLFLFARNVDGCEGVRRKSVVVLKSKFKELRSSEEYKTLFHKDPDAAMELCASAFSL